jgi:hypothetical protein
MSRWKAGSFTRIMEIDNHSPDPVRLYKQIVSCYGSVHDGEYELTRQLHTTKSRYSYDTSPS